MSQAMSAGPRVPSRRATGAQGARRRRKLRPTAERGYGGPHVTARTHYTAAFTPGQPCAIGGEPLWHHTRRKWCDLLDLAHDHVNGGYLGLSCRKHNRGHHDKRRRLQVMITSRPW
jgi:hypothetical protein